MQNSNENFCSKCGHELIKCKVDDGPQGLLVKNPQGGGFFKNNKNTIVHPYICSECGFTEWFAEKPKNLL